MRGVPAWANAGHRRRDVGDGHGLASQKRPVSKRLFGSFRFPAWGEHGGYWFKDWMAGQGRGWRVGKGPVSKGVFLKKRTTRGRRVVHSRHCGVSIGEH